MAPPDICYNCDTGGQGAMVVPSEQVNSSAQFIGGSSSGKEAPWQRGYYPQ